MESDRDKTLQVMARASCNTGEVACEACHLTAERILTALEASGRAVVTGWQPIESAPKDGEEVILGCWMPKYAAWLWVEDACWVDDGWNLTEARAKCEAGGYPATHWQPLLASPYGKAVVQEASAERSVANSKPVVKEDSE
jgi:hypothetical protein